MWLKFWLKLSHSSFGSLSMWHCCLHPKYAIIQFTNYGDLVSFSKCWHKQRLCYNLLSYNWEAKFALSVFFLWLFKENSVGTTLTWSATQVELRLIWALLKPLLGPQFVPFMLQVPSLTWKDLRKLFLVGLTSFSAGQIFLSRFIFKFQTASRTTWRMQSGATIKVLTRKVLLLLSSLH